MKGKAIFASMLMLLLGVWSCSGPDDGGEITTLEKSVSARGNTFALEIFPALNALQEDENVLISPFSISTALSMTYNGARGETQTAMAEALGFSDMSVEDVNLAYKNLTNYLRGADNKVTLDIANSIWADAGFSVDSAFLAVNRSYYDAVTNTLDFGNPASVATINQWVSDNTNQKIESIIDAIPPEAVMYLVNALYFKAAWTWEFDPDLTVETSFYRCDGGTEKADMMRQTAEFYYYQNDDLQMVDLPYGDEKFSMTLILPAYETDINDFIAGITQSEWDSWMDSLSGEKTLVEVRLPRFSFEYKATLNDVLTALGMGPVFAMNADFTGINPLGGLYISRVLHKTFIEVNEEGTEAAAATAVEVGVVSVPDYPVFVANRPFLFAIREQESGSIFFMGKMLGLAE
ncbi:MAG: serpin family protein [Candidatus Marinimicrobia bacterium]|nr:serpin family protein [Candidatus Neomarinimicrobiota bacterium]